MYRIFSQEYLACSNDIHNTLGAFGLLCPFAGGTTSADGAVGSSAGANVS